jgi:hypothetical protein
MHSHALEGQRWVFIYLNIPKQLIREIKKFKDFKQIGF